MVNLHVDLKRTIIIKKTILTNVTKTYCLLKKSVKKTIDIE